MLNRIRGGVRRERADAGSLRNGLASDSGGSRDHHVLIGHICRPVHVILPTGGLSLAQKSDVCCWKRAIKKPAVRPARLEPLSDIMVLSLADF